MTIYDKWYDFKDGVNRIIMKIIKYMIAIVLISGVIAFTLTWQLGRHAGSKMPSFSSDFTLTSHQGEPVAFKSINNNKMVFFGFANCPDVCPTTLQKIVRAHDALGDLKSKIAPIFITIDPLRDDVETLKTYVETFSPDIIGLTGSEAEIEDVIKKFKLHVAKNGEGEDYLIDHTSFIYVLNKKNELATFIKSDAKAEEITPMIKQLFASNKLSN